MTTLDSEGLALLDNAILQHLLFQARHPPLSALYQDSMSWTAPLDWSKKHHHFSPRPGPIRKHALSSTSSVTQHAEYLACAQVLLVRALHTCYPLRPSTSPASDSSPPWSQDTLPQVCSRIQYALSQFSLPTPGSSSYRIYQRVQLLLHRSHRVNKSRTRAQWLHPPPLDSASRGLGSYVATLLDLQVLRALVQEWIHLQSIALDWKDLQTVSWQTLVGTTSSHGTHWPFLGLGQERSLLSHWRIHFPAIQTRLSSYESKLEGLSDQKQKKKQTGPRDFIYGVTFAPLRHETWRLLIQDTCLAMSQDLHALVKTLQNQELDLQTLPLLTSQVQGRRPLSDQDKQTWIQCIRLIRSLQTHASAKQQCKAWIEFRDTWDLIWRARHLLFQQHFGSMPTQPTSSLSEASRLLVRTESFWNLCKQDYQTLPSLPFLEQRLKQAQAAWNRALLRSTPDIHSDQKWIHDPTLVLAPSVQDRLRACQDMIQAWTRWGETQPNRSWNQVLDSHLSKLVNPVTDTNPLAALPALLDAQALKRSEQWHNKLILYFNHQETLYKTASECSTLLVKRLKNQDPRPWPFVQTVYLMASLALAIWTVEERKDI